MNQKNKDIKNYAAFLSKLTGNELSIIAMACGYLLSQGLTSNQQNSLGNFLEAVGQIMLCISAQDFNLNDLNENGKNNN